MRADARRNYERIVAIAREAFTEQGADVPLDVIARRAGVGNATLYRHFATRDMLVEAVYRPDIEHLASAALDLATRHAPREALELWLREHFIPAQEQHGFAVVLKDALARAPEIFAASKKEFNDATDRLINAARHAGAIRGDIPTRDILRMAHGITVASKTEPESRERMITVMFDGLRPKPACTRSDARADRPTLGPGHQTNSDEITSEAVPPEDLLG
jgi:AcrR family transcriptional regulator